MKYLLTCFVCTFLLLTAVQGQNLVPSPGFEVLDSCPDGSSQIDRATGWYPFTSSPDLIHDCWQNPFACPATGRGYTRLIFHYDQPSAYEIMGAKLLDTLKVGDKYYASFKVRLDPNSGVAINKIGIQFSTRKYCYTLNDNTNLCDSTPAPINNAGHIYSSNIIKDTNWTVVNGAFIMDSAYSFIIVGLLFDTSETDTIKLPPTGDWGFYYFDDICVSKDSLKCMDITPDMIDFIADSTVIQEGGCVSFNINTGIKYNNYYWQFEGASPNNSTDSLPSGICYNAAGSFDVKLMATTDSGCTDMIIKNNYIIVSEPASVNKKEHPAKSRLLVYPNPANKQINITYPTDHSNDLIQSLHIYDVFGNMVYQAPKFNQTPEFININNFEPGFYMLELKTTNEIVKGKFFKPSKP